MEYLVKFLSDIFDRAIGIGSNISFWLIFGGSVVAFVLIYQLSELIAPKNNFKKRLGDVEKKVGNLRDNSTNLSVRKTESETFMKRIVDNYNLRSAFSADNLELRLLRAGIYDPSASTKYFFGKVFCPFAFLVVFVLLSQILFFLPISPTMAALGGLALGFYAPGIYIENAAKSRLREVMEVFPDALDLLLICVETGMSIEAALRRVSNEFASASPALSQEFTMLVAELNYLEERRQAFENITKRLPHPGVKSIATAFVQAERFGTPIGQTLRLMADENRVMRVMAAEKKAAALPAKLTVPMIVFFVPVLFLVILTPAYIQWRIQNEQSAIYGN